MSVRAEILRLGLRIAKKWHIRERVAVPTARRRLKRIESLVPRPPAGTQKTAIDARGGQALCGSAGPTRSGPRGFFFPRGGHARRTPEMGRGFSLRGGARARAPL